MEWHGHFFFGVLANMIAYFVFHAYHDSVMAFSCGLFAIAADIDWKYIEEFGHRNFLFHSSLWGAIGFLVTVLLPDPQYLFTGYMCLAMATHLLIDTAYKKRIIVKIAIKKRNLWKPFEMKLWKSRVWEFTHGLILLGFAIYCLWW